MIFKTGSQDGLATTTRTNKGELNQQFTSQQSNTGHLEAANVTLEDGERALIDTNTKQWGINDYSLLTEPLDKETTEAQHTYSHAGRGLGSMN